MLRKAKQLLTRQYMKNVLKEEKEFKIERNSGRIKYLLQSNKKSDKLLVVFSGFPPKGKNPLYNYVSKFRNLNCNKLFILDDFGDDYRGTYYLGTNDNWFLIDEITNLISFVKNQISVKNENITLGGSSKGGFAALYYAFKDNYGSVIAGEPQIMLGDYVAENHHIGVFNNIMGEYSDEKKERLNKALFEIIDRKDEYPNKIVILCGKENDYYINNHINHFTSFLDNKSIPYKLVLEDFSEHLQIGKYYPKLVFEHYITNH